MIDWQGVCIAALILIGVVILYLLDKLEQLRWENHCLKTSLSFYRRLLDELKEG